MSVYSYGIVTMEDLSISAITAELIKSRYIYDRDSIQKALNDPKLLEFFEEITLNNPVLYIVTNHHLKDKLRDRSQKDYRGIEQIETILKLYGVKVYTIHMLVDWDNKQMFSLPKQLWQIASEVTKEATSIHPENEYIARLLGVSQIKALKDHSNHYVVKVNPDDRNNLARLQFGRPFPDIYKVLEYTSVEMSTIPEPPTFQVSSATEGVGWITSLGAEYQIMGRLQRHDL